MFLPGAVLNQTTLAWLAPLLYVWVPFHRKCGCNLDEILSSSPRRRARQYMCAISMGASNTLAPDATPWGVREVGAITRFLRLGCNAPRRRHLHMEIEELRGSASIGLP